MPNSLRELMATNPCECGVVYELRPIESDFVVCCDPCGEMVAIGDTFECLELDFRRYLEGKV